ncbi:heterokaryon incompatibility domain-containing protein [Trichoderma aethiopicum]
MTCNDCLKIFKLAAPLIRSRSAEEPPRPLIDASYQARLAANAASSQCHMCTLLVNCMPELLKAADSKEQLKFEICLTPQDPDSIHVGLVQYYGESMKSERYFPGALRIQSVNHGNVSVLQSTSTWSIEALNRIRSWLETCTLSHNNCATPEYASRLPRRLIDVMSTQFSRAWPMDQLGEEDFNLLSLQNFPNVRIVSLSSLPSGIPYFTLSHKWGNPSSILLTKETSYLLNEDIAPHLLNSSESAVFGHAIHITRALGYRYIWIDALCIMQDDGPEKMEDVMNMDEIYSNCTLTISASEGRTREGLAFDRKLDRINPCQTTVTLPESEEEVQLYSFSDKYFLRPLEKPLNRRGWVFQERTLAPRIVHFTNEQVFWECHSLTANEVLPEGLSKASQTGIDRRVSSNLPLDELKYRWYAEIMTRYSATSLTFADDRLLAVSAVAKQFCAAMQRDPSSYLAGIWEDDLPVSLLWGEDHRPRMGGTGPPATKIITEVKSAPSWSWASILGPVSCTLPTYQKAAAEVLEVHTKRTSPNFFDGVDSCRLRLRGSMCKFTRGVQNDEPWIYIAQRPAFQEYGQFRHRGEKAITIEWDVSRRAIARYLRTFREDPSPPEFFLFHISSMPLESRTTERGIILKRTADKGTFSRVGRFMFALEGAAAVSGFEDAFKDGHGISDDDDYIQLDSDGKYMIDLI